MHITPELKAAAGLLVAEAVKMDRRKWVERAKELILARGTYRCTDESGSYLACHGNPESDLQAEMERDYIEQAYGEMDGTLNRLLVEGVKAFEEWDAESIAEQAMRELDTHERRKAS